MDFTIGVQVELSILLGIEERLLSFLGRYAKTPHIALGYGILVPVSLSTMLHSSLTQFSVPSEPLVLFPISITWFCGSTSVDGTLNINY
jgi:hypothetical protein